MSDKPFAENFKFLTNCLFRDFNFELRDIKEVKYADIVKNPPIVFSKVDFSSETPKTNLFINFDKINKIKEGAINPREHYIKFSEEIANSVAEGNEYNLISNLVEVFKAKLSKVKNIDLSAIDKAIKETKIEHNLNINYEVLDIRDRPMPHALHYVRTSRLASGEYFSQFIINPMLHKEFLLNQLPHEFTHLLNENSVIFNKIDEEIPRLNTTKIMFENTNGLVKTYNENREFLNAPTTERKTVYDNLLNELIKNNPKENKREIIAYLESVNRNEVFTYSKSRQSFNDYKADKNLFPAGLFNGDFLNYILSVKYDSAKIASLGT